MNARIGKTSVWSFGTLSFLCGAVLTFSGLTYGQDAEAKPDLTVSLKSSELLRPHQDITVTVTVKNIGGSPAPKSDCRILIRNGHAPRETVRTIKKDIRALDAGGQYAFAFSIKLELGLYEIEAVVDSKKKIDESNEANNQTRIMIEGK